VTGFNFNWNKRSRSKHLKLMVNILSGYGTHKKTVGTVE
jgi:hypothetical protein